MAGVMALWKATENNKNSNEYVLFILLWWKDDDYGVLGRMKVKHLLRYLNPAHCCIVFIAVDMSS